MSEIRQNLAAAAKSLAAALARRSLEEEDGDWEVVAPAEAVPRPSTSSGTLGSSAEAPTP